MSEKTLTVTHAGQTFERTTAVAYTHAVLVRIAHYHIERGRAVGNAAASARETHSFFVQEANPYTRMELHNNHQLATISEVAAMTLKQYVKRCCDIAAASIERDRKTGKFHFVVLGWCESYDLAEDIVGRARKHGYAEVVLAEVALA